MTYVDFLAEIHNLAMDGQAAISREKFESWAPGDQRFADLRLRIALSQGKLTAEELERLRVLLELVAVAASDAECLRLKKQHGLH